MWNIFYLYMYKIQMVISSEHKCFFKQIYYSECETVVCIYKLYRYQSYLLPIKVLNEYHECILQM